MVPTALRTLLLWLLPRVITTLLLTALPRRCQPYCEAGATVLLTVLPSGKNLLLWWRYWLVGAGVRTFAAACGWRSSLACLLGALAAAPGSVAMLEHRRIAFRAALARWRFRFQAGLEFFPFAWSHHFYVGNVRSA